MAAIGPNKKPIRKALPNAYFPDLNGTSSTPGGYAHHTRLPNSNYHVQMYQWRNSQNTHEVFHITKEEEDKATERERFMHRTGIKQKERMMNVKVEEKFVEYDKSVDEKRNRLRALLEQEEKTYIKETIDRAQKGKENVLQNSLKAMHELRAKKEVEERALVREKRMQQYKERSDDYKLLIVTENLIETKIANMQQMREKQSRREKEKEIDKMWHLTMLKEIEQLKEREEQNVLEIKERQKGCMEVIRKQILAAKRLQEEERLIGLEDREEMQKQIEREHWVEMESLEGELKKKQKFAAEIREQLKANRALEAERRRKEDALDDLFARLSRAEVERERSQIQSFAEQLHKEQEMYLAYVVKVKRERAEQERRIEQFVQEEERKYQEKIERERCVIIEHWQQVKREVMDGRAKQIEMKRKKDEENANTEKMEVECLNQISETNRRLRQEYERNKCQENKSYSEDLLKQIAYVRRLRDRENAEIERQLRNAQEEEIRYKKLVQDLHEHELSTDICLLHPFRRALNKKYCSCPGNKKACALHKIVY